MFPKNRNCTFPLSLAFLLLSLCISLRALSLLLLWVSKLLRHNLCSVAPLIHNDSDFSPTDAWKFPSAAIEECEDGFNWLVMGIFPLHCTALRFLFLGKEKPLLKGQERGSLVFASNERGLGRHLCCRC